MNTQSLVPYVPVAPRVRSRHKSQLQLLVSLFDLVDHAATASLRFNHTPHLKGVLTIAPDQLNDLAAQLNLPALNMQQLEDALQSLLYPCFKGRVPVAKKCHLGRPASHGVGVPP